MIAAEFIIIWCLFTDTCIKVNMDWYKSLESGDLFTSVDASIFDIMKNTKNNNTVKQLQESYFRRFQQRCISKQIEGFPARPSVVAILLSGLIQQGVSEVVLYSFFIE